MKLTGSLDTGRPHGAAPENPCVVGAALCGRPGSLNHPVCLCGYPRHLLVLLFLLASCTNERAFPLEPDEPSIDSSNDAPTDPHDATIESDDLNEDSAVNDDPNRIDSPTEPEVAPDDGLNEVEETQTGAGTWDDPFIVESFPFFHEDNTAESLERQVDAYACAPDIDESGAEVVYLLSVPAAGFVVASVEESAGDVDVDLHLMAGTDPDSCLDRGNRDALYFFGGASATYLVADTWVNSSQEELAGPYALQVDFLVEPTGPCSLEHDAIEMFNRDEPLEMPAFGPVVLEAHLVTTEEFPDSWPTSAWDGIPEHYVFSEGVTGYSIDRTQSWAPEGEGGSQWGQGSTSRPPPLDEGWYVNMYWRNRPPRGTRMLVFNPKNGRGVVTAGGYETGPGSATAIGGASEEIHDVLGTTHRSVLLMGFLVDQELSLGPIECASP